MTTHNPITASPTTARPDTVRARRVVGLAVVPLVAALALVGCSDGGDGAATGGSGTTGGAATGSPATSAPTDGAAPTDGTSVRAGNGALLAAVDTALDAVDRGTVTSVEQEQGGSAYEVHVVTGDGSEYEVRTSADGRTVYGSPRSEAVDADDRAENERFVAAADLDVRAAVAATTDRHDGTVTEIGLDDHLGAVVWEADVTDPSGTRHSVRIDAGSGAVVTDVVDTDD